MTITDTRPTLDERSADFHRIDTALTWLADRWRERPSLEEAAEATGLSPSHFQRVFTRWAGVSPKAFMGALTHAEARAALEDGASVLDAAYDVGLSGPSRLHDLFLLHESATPGEARRRGEGLALTYGFAPTPFGRALFVATPRGLCGLGFCDTDGDDIAFDDMHRRWPAAEWSRDDAAMSMLSAQIFGDGPMPALDLIGPAFRIQVWKALLRIPAGRTATYGQVAAMAGAPKAARAVGAAIGANPISWLIPCHRALAKDGRLTGYHWGLGRKVAMLGTERLAAD